MFMFVSEALTSGWYSLGTAPGGSARRTLNSQHFVGEWLCSVVVVVVVGGGRCGGLHCCADELSRVSKVGMCPREGLEMQPSVTNGSAAPRQPAGHMPCMDMDIKYT
ncbi:hypothetical protein E2C01_054164 [Portunus trituberculatus]|uniref:Uncharacterized protein n=1 Tax=Portunus trituberculatus TaxID=210409 RepID=A0A5B7GSG1_PORTR|nr:hypothetical protein [Portunus trituberculatus]